MQIQPYLFFDGRCEQALEFYRKVLGAEITQLLRFRDSPEPQPPGSMPPDSADKVMHAAFRVGNTVVMASDGRCSGQPEFKGFALSLTVPDSASADRTWAALAERGQVQMALAATFFSPRFGMVEDRYGVSWMIMVEPATATSATEE